jgi:uncharacterized oligopeptide transporter (OPT) family protein
LKTGYWLGSTPMRQERLKFVGVVASAVAAALTIAVLAKVFAFGEAPEGDTRPILESPQAAIMKELVHSFMSREPVPVILFGAGAMVTLMMEMLGVPALIFALGMYLPLYLNSPALVGGFLAHYLERRATRAGGRHGASIRERGIVIASGLMAGGALGGVLGAAMRLIPDNPLTGEFQESWVKTPFFDDDPVSQMVSAGGFALFVLYVWWVSQRTPRER